MVLHVNMMITESSNCGDPHPLNHPTPYYLNPVQTLPLRYLYQFGPTIVIFPHLTIYKPFAFFHPDTGRLGFNYPYQRSLPSLTPPL